MTERPVFPFTALVGQERMRTALLLHAVHPGLGGVLVRGRKGTAKSTAVRALSALLPEIDCVADCPFACDPSDRAACCDACADRLQAPEPPPAVSRPVPVVELPIGATEDRVLGSLDLETAIQSGLRRFEPGLLARANRGILYVDEVNLLGDHLVDILLDAAAMGRNYVEREGVSFSHPASFMLIGTMNPEEGELRPQLLDRFALAVDAEGLNDPLDRAEAVRRRIAFEADPRAFTATWATSEEQERCRLAQARAALPSVSMPEAMLDLIVRICAEFEVDGLRADLAIYRAATALAAYASRTEVATEDVRTAAQLALPHRRRRLPFDDTGLDGDRLDQLVDESRQNSHEKPASPAGTGSAGVPPVPGDGLGNGPEAHAPRTAQENLTAPDRPLSLTLPAPEARQRPATPVGRRRACERDHAGAPAAVARPRSPHFELAVAATLRAAAPFQPGRRAAGPGPAIRLRSDDLRERVRGGRTSALVCFLVDASGSMGAQRRMATTKAAVIGLLLDAYHRRDRVALVAFRNDSAELILPPTNSVELAERRLRFLPTGGRTPLAAGLELARTTIERAERGLRRQSPLLVLVSDGRANAAANGADPWRSALEQAQRIRRAGWTATVLDTEKGRAGTGLGRALAQALGAEHLPLGALANHPTMLRGTPRQSIFPNVVRSTGGSP